MLEIQSFNALFVAAKSAGIRLKEFSEDSAGFFYCQWRRGHEVGPSIQRRLPFNAALDSFLALRDAAVVEEPEPAELQDDLFG